MVWKRRNRSRRRYYRQKRRYFKRSRGRLQRFKKMTDVHWFKRSFIYQDITATTGINFAWSFRMSQMSGYTQFAAIYDMFLLKSVTLRCEPTCTSVDIAGNQAGLFGQQMTVVWDYDDDSPLSVSADYLSYSRMKRYPICGKPFKIKLYPKMRVLCYEQTGGGSVSDGYMARRPGWVDWNSSNTKFYGLKAEYPDTGSHVFGMRIIATYVFACKGVRGA